MNPLALMTLGLAPIPTFSPAATKPKAEPKKPRNDVAARRAEIVEMIGSDGPMNRAEIRDAFGKSKDVIAADVAALTAARLIRPRVIGGVTYYWRPLR